MIWQCPRMIVAIIFLFIFSPVQGIVFAEPMGNADTFFQANQFYEQGDYNKAIEQYSQLLNQNIASNAIHFNLGNAYFRGNQLGQAIFHFRKAFYLSPRLR